jgi:hypothetical protein
VGSEQQAAKEGPLTTGLRTTDNRTTGKKDSWLEAAQIVLSVKGKDPIPERKKITGRSRQRAVCNRV